jgi:hypothetical protein
MMAQGRLWDKKYFAVRRGRILAELCAVGRAAHNRGQVRMPCKIAATILNAKRMIARAEIAASTISILFVASASRRLARRKEARTGYEFGLSYRGKAVAARNPASP